MTRTAFFAKATQILTAASLALTASTFVASAAPWAARHGMTPAQYQSNFDKYTAKGYRLTDVSAYSVNGKARYAAIWEKASGPAWVARHGMNATAYQAKFDDLTAKGYAPAFLDGMGQGQSGTFAAYWEKSGGAWVARHGLTGSAYQAEFDKWVSKGYRLVDVSGYEVKGAARYAAIWKKVGGGAWQARHGMTASKYQTTFDKMTAKGFKPVHVDAYTVKGTAYFAAIWVKSGGAYVARHGLSGSAYQAEFDKWTSKGYRLVDVSGYSSNGKARYAAIWHK